MGRQTEGNIFSGIPLTPYIYLTSGSVVSLGPPLSQTFPSPTSMEANRSFPREQEGASGDNLRSGYAKHKERSIQRPGCEECRRFVITSRSPLSHFTFAAQIEKEVSCLPSCSRFRSNV